MTDETELRAEIARLRMRLAQSRADVQKVLLDTAKQAASYQHELMYEYEDRSVSELKERGMQVNEVDKDAFVAAVKPIWDRFIEKYGDAGVKLALESQK